MVEIRRTSNSRRRQIADRFAQQVAKKEALRRRGIRHQGETVWFGLGMFGIVGWAVAIPTLIGIALGLWIDRTWPTQYSWALMFLIAGVIVGWSSSRVVAATVPAGPRLPRGGTNRSPS